MGHRKHLFTPFLDNFDTDEVCHALKTALRSTRNHRAYDLLDPTFAEQFLSYPDNEKAACLIDYDWWADSIIPIQRRFERWLQA